MLNPFKDNTIETRVMEKVRGRIASAQKEYDDKRGALEKAHEAEVSRLGRQLEIDKETSADNIVNTLFGNL